MALARTTANLTQRELGRLSGVPQATIARIETGTVSPKFETISRILAGAGLEMRIQIAERDTHDEVLGVRYNSLSEEEKGLVDEQHQYNLRMFSEAGRKGGRFLRYSGAIR